MEKPSLRGSLLNFFWKAIGLLLYSTTFRLPYLGVVGLLRLFAGQRRYDEIWERLPMRKLQILMMLPDNNKLFSLWGQSYQTEFMVEEIYHKEVYDFFFAPEKDFIVLDVGANIGVYSLRAARKVGEHGLVIAVEPETENFRLLLKNVHLNGYRNIIPMKLALSNFEDTSHLFVSAYSGKHSLLFRGSNPVKVSVTTVARVLERLRIAKIDLMKIDVEGAELEVLKGSEQMLRSRMILRIVSAAYHTPTQAIQIKSFLQDCGYNVKTYASFLEGHSETFISADIAPSNNRRSSTSVC